MIRIRVLWLRRDGADVLLRVLGGDVSTPVRSGPPGLRGVVQRLRLASIVLVDGARLTSLIIEQEVAVDTRRAD